MYIDYIKQVRNQLFTNDDYAQCVAQFGMDYSLTEALWTDIEEIGNIDNFCKKFARYYWSLPAIKEKARKFASIECVGSSKLNRYGNEQTEEIAQATAFLRYESGLFSEDNIPDCNLINCRYDKKDKNLCNRRSGSSWKNRRDHVDNITYASFKALFYIVRQIRNNLFHGNKFDLEKKQQARNIMLIRNATEILQLILDNLSEAEFESRKA